MGPESAGRLDLYSKDADPAIGFTRVWINLLRVQRSTMARLARELRAGGIGDPLWAEIFVQVERAGKDGIVMSALEHHLHCPQYSLSRHVKRLEELGYVTSAAADGPGRSKRIMMTDLGRSKKVELDDVLAEIIQKELATRLTVEEAYDLTHYLMRLYP